MSRNVNPTRFRPGDQAPLPPRWADWLLEWLVAPHLLEYVQGDLHEVFFKRVAQAGATRARWEYAWAVLQCLTPFFTRRKPSEHPQPSSLSLHMLGNYTKIALRTLSRSKLYAVLNVAGLTFGLTCFVLIGLYLFDELTFDRQHDKADRIYRVIEHRKDKTQELTIAAASYLLAEESKKQLPQVENTVRISRVGRANLSSSENPVKFQETIAFADPSLMEIFDFEVVDGETKTALQEPNSIIIVEDLAQRLFNSTRVAGRTVQLDIMDAPLKVTAVLKNHPRNSSFDFSSMLSMTATPFGEEAFKDWSSHDYLVFALLKANAEPEAVARKMTSLVRANAKPEAGTSRTYSLQPLADLHLHSEGIVDGARNQNVPAMAQGTRLYLQIFALVAGFVLLIASINYMNLTTARATRRAKEIGVRKVNGALRSQLVKQFLVESLLITGLAFLLSVLLVNLALPAFNAFTGKQLSLWLGTDYRIWLCTLGAVGVTGLFSGSYPALLLSRLKPVVLFKTIPLSSKGNLSLRKGLVVFQFTISVVIIIATMVLYLQIRYVNSKDLGFKKDLLVVVDINSGKARKEAGLMKAELAKLSEVKTVSVTSRVPGEWKTIPTVKIYPRGDGREPRIAYLIAADEEFSRTFGVKLLQGRNFDGPADSSAVLLNETAAKALRIEEASGQLVEIPARAFGGTYEPLNKANRPFMARVVGIVKDFHFQSLREKIAPLVLAYQHNPVHVIDYFTAGIADGDLPATLKKIEAAMAKVDPDHTFEYHFLDEQLARFYLEDQRRETLLIWVALAAIFIACLGLFGLATFTAEQRIKEIGVRKVLGASTSSIVVLLSKDFLKLVLLAILLASPIAWYATRRWLEEFAYHIDVAWWLFVLAGLLAVGIALLTVSFQSIKAALANPVKSLRAE
ncbi:MAG: ABC transporter permease [Cytophagales bacterium]|nr:ABC transporter permease [Cytophagales bacterium]